MPIPLQTYSFTDVVAIISGPGGSFQVGGDGAGNAEEGITVSMTEEKDLLTMGADGSPMHSLRQSQAGKMTIRVLKTSPTNAQLSALYDFQRGSSAVWGQNVLTVRDFARGDVVKGTSAAFAKFPDLTYDRDGRFNEWEFNVGILDPRLGDGFTAF